MGTLAERNKAIALQAFALLEAGRFDELPDF